MKTWITGLRAVAVAALGSLALAACGQKAEETAAAPAAGQEYTIGWTIYAGWMPWPYAEQAGIVKKWSDKYGVNIKLVQINDYVESLNQFTAGKLDGVTSTNMDALTIPAAAGKDTTVVIVGDYSNGNDGVILKGGSSMADIKGRSVNLVENSVSHYLLARALESAGLAMTDVTVVNTSDADIVAAFAAPETTAVVPWNPQLAEIKKMPNATEVFNSTQIPGEILDMMIVSTEALQANPNLGKALAGIWYETMALMSADTPEGAAAREAMAKIAGTDLAGYEDQLKTTYMYYQPQAALAAMTGEDIVAANDKVRQFSFQAGLFGQGARSVDDIGLEFPGGKILGDADNVKLRFDPTYTQAAADGSL
ncbi:putative urea ABC transporter substrate-binding protein [Phenylobacterium sp.]|uniref:putative urea ABC transporter substrate-binding protein n=1 Tax=Phenylobacterium sp. TaxID=1871053 RepID=UPI0008C8EA8B|nr:putative urea ABC transporter substrate-binding protein [Phenylobacterium sp.]MBA4793115.1 ABC transporter substrate-binding protein [Phenylobacterium sp.]OHB36585.1 MAG: lipid kinase [Phenylobacterium sp. RIFCSPHIGHO2_01_FULL_70_10]